MTLKKILTVILMTSAGFSQAQTYFLNGTAQAIGDDCYQLTTELATQNGTVWYANQINLTQPFDLQFLMNFGTIDGNGADGICFVLQTVGTNAIGESGGGLGYLNFGTSLGIEFDTWQNGNYGDPAEDHIAIEKNGDIDHNGLGNIAGPIQADPLNINIEDGEDHVTRIVWNPDTQIIQVYFDCVFRLAGEVDLINEIFFGQELVYWGFTAATGGSFNNQTVCLQENILNVGQEIDLCTGGSIELNAGSSLDGVYTWSPTTFLDDPTIANPLASPPADAIYTVSFLDLCNVPVELQFDITVSPLTVTLDNIDVINCINNESDISADINFNVDANYTWSLEDNVVASGQNIDNYSADIPGNYLVSVSAMNGCLAEETFEVLSDFTTYTVSAGDDLVINCFNATVTLDGSTNGNDADIFWEQNGMTIQNANDLQYTTSSTGSYTINVVHPISGCSASDEVLVTSDFATPSVSVGAQDSLTCVKPQIPLANVNITSENPYSIQWTTEEGTILSGGTTANAFVGTEAFYSINVIDNNTGCSETESVFVGESENFNLDLSSLAFPNIITANGDSKNESWKPFLTNDNTSDLSSVFVEYDLQIFDRWGKLAFASKSFNSAWRGTEQSEGVFFYILNYKTFCDAGRSGSVQGFVHLLK